MLQADIRPSFYQDSVVLMRLAAELRARPGVREAAAFLGTPANHELMAQSGLANAETSRAGPDDLVIVVEADDAEAARAALAAAEDFLSARRPVADEDAPERPRTLAAALEQAPDATLVSISVPGAYVRVEAMRALRADRSVFIFSDNVPLADEVALKREALARGLLCMGPDCGTAYLGGVGLGFHNVVPRGRVGVIAASGTGLQAVASALAAEGEGLSHGIGVGGRDLSAEVDGLMTLRALEMLAQDPATELVVLVSKPPHPGLLPRLNAALEALGKPAVVCCLGAVPPQDATRSTPWVQTLADASAAALARLRGQDWQARPVPNPEALRSALDQVRARGAMPGDTTPQVLGLYTGGTLAHEALQLLAPRLGTVPFNPEAPPAGHAVYDLGEDRFTLGRPHPMIDPETRVRFLEGLPVAAERVLLFDLVLGRGSHADPAGPLAAALERIAAKARAGGGRLLPVGAIVGTAHDPQPLAAQVRRLEAAGAVLLPTNADAALLAALLASPSTETTLLGDRS